MTGTGGLAIAGMATDGKEELKGDRIFMRHGVVFFLALLFIVSLPYEGGAAMDIPYLSPGDQPYEPLPPDEMEGGEIVDPPRVAFPGPPDVVVVPSGSTYVYMVPNTPGFYFYDGYWYRYYRGYWFRSSAYNGRWSYLESALVPRYIMDVPPEYVYHLPRGYHRVHYNDLHRNWRTWEQGRHWNRYGWFKNELRDDIRRDRYDRIRRDRDRTREGRDRDRTLGDRGRDRGRDRDRDRQGGGRGDGTFGRDKQGGGTRGGQAGLGGTRGGGTKGGDGDKIIMKPFGVSKGGQRDGERGGQRGGQTGGQTNLGGTKGGGTKGGGTKGGDGDKIIMNPIGVSKGGQRGGDKGDASRGKEKDSGNHGGNKESRQQGDKDFQRR